MHSLRTFVTIFLLVVAVSGFYYDLNEIRNVIYDLEFSSNVAGIDPSVDLSTLTYTNLEEFKQNIVDRYPKEDDSSVVHITSHSGQKFACALPKTDLKADVGGSYNPDYLAEIVSASFYTHGCVDLDQGWWKYEFCRGKRVRQYHGAKNEHDQVENILGAFAFKYAMPDYTNSTADRLLYFQEWYEGGTICDLPGKRVARRTAVRYECDPSLPTNGAVLDRIEESASCEYVMYVKIGSLCKLKAFVPPEQDKGLGIWCQPVLPMDKIHTLLDDLLAVNKRKEDAAERANVLKNLLTSILRRRSSMKRTEMLKDPLSTTKPRKNRLKTEFEAVAGKLVDAKYEAVHGKEPSPNTKSILHQLINIFEDDTSYYDYDTDADEDRGNLWYYFNDPSWDMKDFPRPLDYVDLSNAYFERVVKKVTDAPLGVYDYQKVFHKLRNGDFTNPSDNQLISQKELLGTLMSYLPWYLEIPPFADNELPATKFKLDAFVSSVVQGETIFGGYENTVYGHFMDHIQHSKEGGTSFTPDSLVLMVAGHLATAYKYIEIVYERKVNRKMTTSEKAALLHSNAIMLDRLVITFQYYEASQLAFGDNPRLRTLTFPKDVYLETTENYDDHSDYLEILTEKRPPFEKDETAQYYLQIATSNNEWIIKAAFDEVWHPVATVLLEEAKAKQDGRRKKEPLYRRIRMVDSLLDADDSQPLTAEKLIELLLQSDISTKSLTIDAKQFEELKNQPILDMDMVVEMEVDLEEIRQQRKLSNMQNVYQTVLDKKDKEIGE